MLSGNGSSVWARARVWLAVAGWLVIEFLITGCASGHFFSAVRDIVSIDPTSTPTIPTATPVPPPTPAGQTGDWTLIFSDDFNGSGLNTKKWHTCFWWDKHGCTIITNHELEWYQPDNVFVNNGSLQLQAQQRRVEASNGNTYPYTSGMISSGRATSNTSQPAKFTFTYGYAEIRAKVPQGKGLWPAFWLLPADHTSRPEIDVMEIIGDEPQTVQLRFHYRADGDEGDVGEAWTGPDFSQGWHRFAIDWQPDALVWYVDGIERWRYEDGAHIPAGPMYLLANLAVGGDWPGAPDGATKFPSDYRIDYVRVWQRAARALKPVG
jgi:beta-glucanase (GH16 family)